MKASVITSLVCRLGAAILTTSAALAGGGQWTLVGWNNLGMHCMDDDYSVFSILPPFNTINAQLIDGNGRLVQDGAGLSLSFEALADPDGSINTTSVGKTNFWDFAAGTYGATLNADTGLTGLKMPGATNTPQPMAWATDFKWFEAVGIPVAPVDDAGRRNTYPLMKLTARDGAGRVLAQTSTVVPVSSEMDCRACHGSNAGDAAKPAAGWVNNPHASRDYRLNILRLHDEKHLADPVFQAALATAGYRPDGLFATANSGTAILCAKCHSSEALGTASTAGTKPLTAAMHSLHANVVNPVNGLKLNDSANRSACYTCHPGSATRCLRGAMGSAVATDGTMAMQCQSCHGSMSQVGAAARTGWFDEPSCGNCHTGTAVKNSGQIRFTSVFDATGARRKPADTTFSTNADTPMAGLSLYRFSKGHGGLQCSACHGSTHAEYPSSHRNDNLQSVKLQGHVGALAECTACHATMPNSLNGGPHGLHPIGQSWVERHGDAAEHNTASCQACHGTDLRGTVLSRAQADRIFTGEFGVKKFFRGAEVSCYSCHNGAGSESRTTHAAPVVTKSRLYVPTGVAASTMLGATAGAKLRVVQQPQHGTVSLSGTLATFHPDPGYSGPDFFTFAATDAGGYVDSAIAATVAVSVGTFTAATDTDGDGIPDLTEYALGLSPDFPSAPLSAPFYETVSRRRFLTLQLDRFLPPPDVTLGALVSGNNKTWSKARVLTNANSLFKARDTVAKTARNHRYIRLQITR